MQNGGLRIRGITKTSTPEHPLITVVTVVFNGAATLEQTILSVVNQNTGYLAEYKNVQDLADGIKSVLTGKIKPEFKGIQKFSIGEVLKKHKALYGRR